MFFSGNFISRKFVFIWLFLLSSTILAGELAQHDSNAQREQAAAEATQQLIKQLGGHLKKEMQTNGPVKAITVCRDIAPQLAAKMSLENGWRVTRVTTRARNSLLGMPDQWESETLADFETRAGKGEFYADMSKAEVVEEAGRSYFRYMKPLAIKPVCLNCHGSDEQIPAAVRSEIDKLYPHDQARNYKVGELRGAVSIKQPMAIPLATPVIKKIEE